MQSENQKKTSSRQAAGLTITEKKDRLPQSPGRYPGALFIGIFTPYNA
jgi:hypothetical protein